MHSLRLFDKRHLLSDSEFVCYFSTFSVFLLCSCLNFTHLKSDHTLFSLDLEIMFFLLYFA